MIEKLKNKILAVKEQRDKLLSENAILKNENDKLNILIEQSNSKRIKAINKINSLIKTLNSLTYKNKN